MDAWFKHVPLRFLGSEKIHDLQPTSKIRKVERRKSKSKSKGRTAIFQRVLLVSAATSEYYIRTAGEPQQQPRRSRAFVSRRASQNNEKWR